MPLEAIVVLAILVGAVVLFVSEKRRWRGDRQGQEAVYASRRIRGERGQRQGCGNEESSWRRTLCVLSGAEADRA